MCRLCISFIYFCSGEFEMKFAVWTDHFEIEIVKKDILKTCFIVKTKNQCLRPYTSLKCFVLKIIFATFDSKTYAQCSYTFHTFVILLMLSSLIKMVRSSTYILFLWMTFVYKPFFSTAYIDILFVYIKTFFILQIIFVLIHIFFSIIAILNQVFLRRVYFPVIYCLFNWWYRSMY